MNQIQARYATARAAFTAIEDAMRAKEAEFLQSRGRAETMADKKTVAVTLDSSREAPLLAQLLKRITYNGVLACAAGKAECDGMIAVIENMRHQLAGQGIAPR